MTWAMTWVTKWEMTCQVVMAAADPPHFREHPEADTAVAMDDHLHLEHRVDPELAAAMDDHLRQEHRVVPELVVTMVDLPPPEHRVVRVATTEDRLHLELQVDPALAEQSCWPS